MESCSPQWLSCDHLSKKMSAKMLPRMYSTDSKSDIINATTLSGDVVIVHRYNPMETYGGWQYSYDGKWNNLSSVPSESGVKLNSESNIRYRQSKSQYGLRQLYYYSDNSNEAVGKILSPKSSNDMKIALMLIHPKPVRSNIIIIDYNHTYTMNEDDLGKDGGILLSDLVTVESPVERIEQPIPHDYISMLNWQEYADFQLI